MEEAPKFETTQEHIPTPEEIQAIFERVTEGKPYVELKKTVDEKGLHLWEIRLSESVDGATTEYWYRRDGSERQGGVSFRVPVVHVVKFDRDGMPTNESSSVAKYCDGKWVYTP